MGFIQGVPPVDLKLRLQAVLPDQCPALSVAEHLSKEEGTGVGGTDNHNMHQGCCRCSVLTQRELRL